LDLNQVISGVRPLLARVLGDGIEVTIQLAPDLGQVRTDLHMFEQALLNLVTNAREAMATGGKLLIETAKVEIGAAHGSADLPSGRYIRPTLADSGTGIPADLKALIFEPFFTTKELGKGPGLGLAMVFGFVKQCGGHIWAESEAGQGTVF